jgi:hypothetical protein
MEIKSESRIAYPLDVVWHAYRDRLPEVAAYIPDIKAIVVHKRLDDGKITRLHNEWISEKEVPAFAQKFLRPDMLRWDDYATWDESMHACDWRIKTRAFTDAVTCGGRNLFVADGPNATRVILSGDLKIDLKEIPGVPKILAGTIAPQVEKFIVSLITPNLQKVNESLGKFLDEKGPR